MDILAGLNAVTLIFVALCVFAIGYRFYGVFMAFVTVCAGVSEYHRERSRLRATMF